jgi:hypothetical protein
MFTALEIRNQLAAALDAEHSDHYRDQEDYIPAINGAIRWMVSVVNMALGQNKIGEEFFREISYTGVFRTDNNSRISLSVFPSEVWSILAIYPKCDTQVRKDRPVPIFPDDTISYFVPNKIYVTSVHDCKRLSVEEWSRNKVNPFEAGYDGSAICGDLIQYAYLSPLNHWNTNTGAHSSEIEIRPRLINEMAAVVWAKKPTEISTINDDIEFPDSVKQLLFNKALNYIAYKQGDGTTAYTVSNNDIQLLLGVLQ